MWLVGSPTCFISYSWDSDEHRKWVLQLAEDLQKHGVKVLLDRYLEPGANLTHFMETAVRESNYVVLVCTPKFADKANRRAGGIGYEAQVVTGEIFHGTSPQKYIPVLRSGSAKQALPSYLLGTLAIDFRLHEAYRSSLDLLLRHIWMEPRHRPVVTGGKPTFAVSDDREPSSEKYQPSPGESSTHQSLIVQVGDETFAAAIGQTSEDRFALAHFWATWCGPCRLVTPILEEIARENADRVSVFGVDVDRNSGSAAKYQIMSIPTMIAFRNGEPRRQIVGAKPKQALLRDLKPLMDEVEEWKAANQDCLALTFHRGRIRVAVVRPDGTYSYLDSAEQRHGLLYVRTESAKFNAELIERFEELLNDPYVKKDVLIRFLERYPDLVVGDEYRTAHSQVFLRHEPETFAPSFVLQPIAGELCDVLEVAPPQHEIASVVNGIPMLSEVVLEAVAKLRAYRDYLEEERNRVKIQDQYGLMLFRPRMFVIIGRSRLLDSMSRRRLESAMSDISLRTWDDVLATARGRLDYMRP